LILSSRIFMNFAGGGVMFHAAFGGKPLKHSAASFRAWLGLGSLLLMFDHDHRCADYQGRGIGDGRSAHVSHNLRFFQPRA
jgi:hypothetical protein